MVLPLTLSNVDWYCKWPRVTSVIIITIKVRSHKSKTHANLPIKEWPRQHADSAVCSFVDAIASG